MLWIDTSKTNCQWILITNLMCFIGANLVAGGPFQVPKVDWFKEGKAKIEEFARLKHNTKKAKNVILFIGDGMGLSTVMASRVYKGQQQGRPGEEEVLSFEAFPNVALSKVYNVDRQVPDSAGTATALMCGVKGNVATLGVNDNVVNRDCDSLQGNEATSIVRWSQLAGKRTGIVTNMRITHATPAAGFAHTPYREWEGDVEDNAEEKWEKGCTDIAYQLIHGTTGKDINVIFGGGRRYFVPQNETDPLNSAAMGRRNDGKNLLKEWQNLKQNTGKNVDVAWNKTQLMDLNTEETDYVLGLFARSHMAYELDRDDEVEPSLTEMTEKAINILDNDDDGFFLMVEGGRIDYGHHYGLPKKALVDTIELDRAVERALELTDSEETLIVVTADHSHVFTIGGGFPTRGNPILGIVDNHDAYYYTPWDNKTFTTLGYTNGPGGEQLMKGEPRPNHTNADTMDDNFVSPALVPMEAETHGGEDVATYASGPWSHLFRGVVEQNYIAHVMAYASCVGEYSSCGWIGVEDDYNKNAKNCPSSSSCHSGTFTQVSLILFAVTLWFEIYNSQLI